MTEPAGPTSCFVYERKETFLARYPRWVKLAVVGVALAAGAVAAAHAPGRGGGGVSHEADGAAGHEGAQAPGGKTAPGQGAKKRDGAQGDTAAQGAPVGPETAEGSDNARAAAFNDASNKVDAESKARMGAATAGMPIPPGMKLPF